MRSLRTIEHERASNWLESTYQNARRFSVPPLNEDERIKIRNKLAKGSYPESVINKLKKTNPEFFNDLNN